MTKLEALAKDCIENHTHRLVDKPTKQDIYLREESIFIQGYRQSEKRIAELKEVHESDKRSLALISKKGADFEKAYNEAEELLDKQIEATYKLFEENKEAKEIIKELLFTSNELDENTRSKAEQFLKEIKENDSISNQTN